MPSFEISQEILVCLGDILNLVTCSRASGRSHLIENVSVGHT